MKQLARQSFEKARQFIQEQARPLDRSRFEVSFGSAPAERVAQALASFQNEDGGFGRAIEPDFRLPTSSPLATSEGLEIARQAGVAGQHAVVRGAIAYLMNSYQQVKLGWAAVPPEVNQVPHAGWWTFDSRAGASIVETRVNPTAKIVGLLHAYREVVPDEFLDAATRPVLQFLETTSELGMNDLISVTSMLEKLPDNLQNDLGEKLRPMVDQIVSRQPSEWAEYSPRPLLYVHSPESPFYPMLSQAVQDNLDYLIDTQQADGSWLPNWTWGDDYPEVWPQARLEWQGNLTLEALEALRAFGRLESLE